MDRIHLLLLLKAALGGCTLILIFLAGWLAREWSWRKRNRQRRYALAVHEAGHTVLAWRSKLELDILCVVAPLEGDPNRGRAYFRPRVSETGPGYKLNLAILYSAGRIAEETLCSRFRRMGNRLDRTKAERLIKEAAEQGRRDSAFLTEKVLERCRCLVRRHRPEIKRVARALMAQECLTTADLENLLGPRPQSLKTP